MTRRRAPTPRPAPTPQRHRRPASTDAPRDRRPSRDRRPGVDRWRRRRTVGHRPARHHGRVRRRLRRLPRRRGRRCDARVDQRGGRDVELDDTALDGFTGATVAGRRVELVGIGCGDDTADRAIQEIRTLVEQDGANVVIGPLSGDEGIAIANYALDHPEVTFINGISGAQDATLHVQAPNFFRFNGDGAQWNAGVGDILFNEGGWETAAVIADDYGFGWTSAAGFTADFCAAGGEVISQVFPPLGTTDYSSFVQQLPDPDEVDGYFWVVGGTGTNASLEAFLNAKGDLTGDQHAGNLFFSPALAEALGTDIAGAYVGGFASLPGDISTPEITAYLASADARGRASPAARRATSRPAVAGARLRLRLRLLHGRLGFIQAFERGRWRSERQPLGAACGPVGHHARRPVRADHARREPSGDRRHVRRPARAAKATRSSRRRWRSCRASTRRSAARTRARPTRPSATTRRASRRTSRGRAPRFPSSTASRSADRRHSSQGTCHDPERNDPEQPESRHAAAARVGGRRVRWTGRRERRRSRRRSRRPAGSPRPERRRQDDTVQRDRRRHHADEGQGADQGCRLHRASVAVAAAARRRPHLPEDEVVRRAHRRGQPLPRTDRKAASSPVALAKPRDEELRAGARDAAATVWLADSSTRGRRSLARPATAARSRDGAGHRTGPDHARRAGVRALARRARAPRSSCSRTCPADTTCC